VVVLLKASETPQGLIKSPSQFLNVTSFAFFVFAVYVVIFWHLKADIQYSNFQSTIHSSPRVHHLRFVGKRIELAQITGSTISLQPFALSEMWQKKEKFMDRPHRLHPLGTTSLDLLCFKSLFFNGFPFFFKFKFHLSLSWIKLLQLFRVYSVATLVFELYPKVACSFSLLDSGHQCVC